MTQKTRIATLALGALLLVPGASVGGLAGAPLAQLASLDTLPAEPASMTVPPTSDPVVVPAEASLNTRGYAAVTSTAATAPAVPADVLAAYSLAAATAPPSCQITVSVLAAIGQVESGNLSGRTLDADHRAVPAILGPVLDGSPYQAVPDSDDGQWDGNRTWDRAIGPMQLIPSTWRVVAVDMDGDGLRDPQDIDDAGGAAMVYLCADHRDLGTAEGLRSAVLAYNHSAAYVTQVLAWKAAYDRTDLTGLSGAAAPMLDAWALPAAESSWPTAATGPVATPTPMRTNRPQARPTATGTAAPAKTPTASPVPPTPSVQLTPTIDPSQQPGKQPSQQPSQQPDPVSTPKPTPKPTPTPTPTCPTPTPTDLADPSSTPTPTPGPTPGPTPAEGVLPGQDDPAVLDPCAPVPSDAPSALPTPAP